MPVSLPEDEITPSAEEPPVQDATPPRKLQVLCLLALIVAVGSATLATWTALHSSYSEPAPAAPSAPVYSDSQRSEAKMRACATIETVRQGVSLNTNQPVPGGEGDIAGALAVAANARLALFLGGQYLLARIEPATPPPLADAMRGFANGLIDIGAAALAGRSNTDPEQDARLKAAEASDKTLQQLCQ